MRIGRIHHALTIAFLCGATHAATLTVTNNADTGAGSLRGQIAAATAGDTIVFQAGLTSPITLATELLINKNLTITGPGATSLTISGNSVCRVFSVPAGITASISGFRITGGNGVGASFSGTRGGAILNQGTLTVTDCVVTGNSFGADGAGLHNTGGTLTIVGCTISNNTIANNGSTGAGIDCTGGTLNVTNSTFSGNQAGTGSSSAGALWINGNGTITACTFANNSIAGANSAGGVLRAGGTVTLRNTIIAGNTSPASTSPDVRGTFASGGNNLIGDGTGSTGITGTGDQVGTGVAPVNAMLGALANNGGTTLTLALLAGSPAIDTGSAFGLTTDQRGTGFPRTIGSATDKGAYERDSVVPTAALTSAPAVNDASNATQYDFTVTFSDNIAVNVSSLNSLDVRVTGPGSFSQLATFVSVDTNTNGTPRIGTYRITPPGGSWDNADNGNYTISLEASQVQDAEGNSAAAATLGTFSVTRTAPTVLPPSPPAVPGIGEVDTDGDGFTDELEVALGTSFTSSASTPFNGLPSGPGRSYEIGGRKLRISLSFGGKDTIRASGSIPVPASVNLAGSTIVFDIGGVIQQFTLDARSHAKKQVDTTRYRLTMRSDGASIGTRNFAFNLSITGPDLDARFADEGLTADKAANKNVNVVVKILYNTTLYRESVPLNYTLKNSQGHTRPR